MTFIHDILKLQVHACRFVREQYISTKFEVQTLLVFSYFEFCAYYAL